MPMRRAPILLATAAVLASSGCEPASQALMSAPEPLSLRLVTPEPGYRLDAAERARVLPVFDTDALERLLAMVRPEMRREVLRHFQQRAPGDKVGHLVQLHDPTLQAVLEEVWAPMWETATDEQIENDVYGLPGRDVARKRREASPGRP